MKKNRSGQPVTLIFASCLLFFVIIFPFPGDVVKTVEITKGNVGDFIIGDSKIAALSRITSGALLPMNECRSGWIDVAHINLSQKECLLRSDEWQVEQWGTEVCPEYTDWHTKVIFTNNKLSKIEIRCFRPK
jgi:hypothetical protein